MERRRPSAPFGNPGWIWLNADDFFVEEDRAGNKLRPELFRMLRRFRRTRIRLTIEVVLLVAAVVVLFFLPNLGELVVAALIGIVTLYDLMLFLHLRTKIVEAWEDLSLGPEG